MTEDDSLRVTNRDVYNALIEFRKEFGDYVKEQGPKIALLEYQVEQLKEKQKEAEDHGFSEKQNRRLYLWSFAGSGVVVEIINYLMFHK